MVKTFGQSVFSFKRFRDSIKKYEKWTISYTKDLRIPMMGYTVAINSVFAIMIAATYLFGNVKSGTADSTFLLNLLFYIIITPIITVTLTKMMYAGENTMVVEDALSRIDSILEMQPLKETEKKKSLTRLIKNKTVMIIAHRMGTVADADKIVVLKDGVVAESGTPEELKKKDGIYANMMKTQLMAADWSL